MYEFNKRTRIKRIDTIGTTTNDLEYRGTDIEPTLPLLVIGMNHMELNFIIHLILFLALLQDVNLKGISCAIFDNSSYSVGLRIALFGDITEPGKIHCNKSNCCMGMWEINNGEIQLAVLGCFPSNAVCKSDICVPVYKQGNYHCLCSSDMCNANISFSRQQISYLNTESAPGSGTSQEILQGTPVRTVIQREPNKMWKAKNCLLFRGESLLENQEVPIQRNSSPPTQPVEGLILLQAIREESLAANQWLGALYGRGVIIKCFPPPLKKLYSQEWRILSLLTPLQHENIVCLLAAGSGTKGVLEHHQLLVFQHYPEGSLRSYLTGRTASWDTACQMAISLTRGLAFLHSEKWNGNICKPAIAHRDLSSDNILVTADSSCVITDFGLSVVLEECQKKKPKDPAILNMTGTLRYMSPEMLDGSLNLMSWEQALTQADVYSLGLLLWEIFSRCNDLYADQQCPEFGVAFSDELGPNPTLDELRSFVVENKRRPQVPRNWCKNLQLFKTLWETLEDCWDPDSEARLTAQCAEQRLLNLLLAPFSLLPEDSIGSSWNV
ncbi:anti-Muellerian hormone type-2 receptor isoform X2 [Dendropsophus ebraccatus]|uniref:anti-Muellerian hormone type-2 receptor isoform X2 n=1 Tax=Dendropsophus ebraccatus TaxID=150705 RepID=UPI0038319023